MVRGYTRKDGTTVKPYSTKAPSAKGRTSGQRDLFGDKPSKLPPNRFKGVDPLAATPDLFDTVSEPRQDLIAEHKRLVAVLRSPSHKDDVAEAKRQEAELREYEGASSAVEKQEVKASEPVKKTETPAFKNWFGNSKVVDAEGKPLVVYHTTPNDFSEFKPGGDNDQKSGRAMWFGVDAHNPQAAHNVLQGRKAGKFKDGVRTMPVYLRMQRPLVIDDSTREWVRSVWGSDFPQIISPEMVADLKQDYDGVIFHSPLNGKISEYIVFEPNQIKSATANNGDYSNHPDMTKAVLFRKVAQ